MFYLHNLKGPNNQRHSNEYILEYSSAVAQMYITKYLSKTFHKFKIHFIANINFFSMRMTIIVKTKVCDGT